MTSPLHGKTTEPYSNFNTPYLPHRTTQTSGMLMEDTPYPKPISPKPYSNSGNRPGNRKRRSMPPTPHPTHPLEPHLSNKSNPSNHNLTMPGTGPFPQTNTPNTNHMHTHSHQPQPPTTLPTTPNQPTPPEQPTNTHKPNQPPKFPNTYKHYHHTLTPFPNPLKPTSRDTSNMYQ